MRQNVFLKSMNVHVAAEDARRIEVLAQDLPYCGGVQLVIDVTLRHKVKPSHSKQGRNCVGESSPREWKMQVCGAGHRDWWTLERRSGAGVEATFLREGSRSSVIGARRSGLDVGKKVDASSGVCNII